MITLVTPSIQGWVPPVPPRASAGPTPASRNTGPVPGPTSGSSDRPRSERLFEEPRSGNAWTGAAASIGMVGAAAAGAYGVGNASVRASRGLNDTLGTVRASALGVANDGRRAISRATAQVDAAMPTIVEAAENTLSTIENLRLAMKLLFGLVVVYLLSEIYKSVTIRKRLLY
ncbi:hypothetical protein EXVG_00294 [Emiliania huxleyi virus 202]|nr:hypothetical protein EXVG_00294 [Emiliania huxleyi virus 202]AHA54082.1 putative membrane protein [Emiliania huxleyi virus 18]AHA55131.1 putative membrane protein [Emiliania huxleyi virus 156]